jgi:hypothetical protein
MEMKMPNWCSNDLYITGPIRHRNRFALHVAGNLPKQPISPIWEDTEALTTFKVLEVQGIGKELVTEVKEYEMDPLSFNTLIPYPNTFKLMDEIAEAEREKGNYKVKDGYNQGGYDWCCRNWGTKWDACEVKVRTTKSSLVYKFDTAWSPPIPVIDKMHEMFPMLQFKLKYFECGVATQGVYLVKPSG